MFFLIVGIAILGYLIYINMKPNNNRTEKVIIKETRENTLGMPGFWSSDPLLNPYAPPLRDERYLTPINVSTNIGAVDTNYRQMGILTPLNGQTKDSILPLMGRPLFTNRNKWQYYTTSNQHNNVKLPLMYKGRSCTNEYGCDQLNNGDSIYVEGANEAYKVTLYDNSTMKYLPFI
jgi:hypothetical protein